MQAIDFLDKLLRYDHQDRLTAREAMVILNGLVTVQFIPCPCLFCFWFLCLLWKCSSFFYRNMYFLSWIYLLAGGAMEWEMRKSYYEKVRWCVFFLEETDYKQKLWWMLKILKIFKYFYFSWLLITCRISF